MSEESQIQKEQLIVIPQDEKFVETHVTAATINVLNDDSIVIEFLKPKISLVVKDGNAQYQGYFVSVARLIMTPATAKKLLNDLDKILQLYKSKQEQGEENEKI
ncbi:hypothetical protein E3E31_08200 [Thermococcus sp. M39]|uniref:DUF3467 domain-containing protein n=1 Tax=Thermococcus sp. M39 TaxID=1638262 RepID=UPI001439016B|nr:DUF3467 domain-containing protein [Thermococcus sp. M39]NJE08502.1 hypothetical protein [Thermococcus sp. M39]